jgi:hypothetical protein
VTPIADRAVREITRQYRLDGYGSLLIAVVLQAVEDAKPVGPRPETKRGIEHWVERITYQRMASHWLEDRGYIWICEATGVPYSAMDLVVEALLS